MRLFATLLLLVLFAFPAQSQVPGTCETGSAQADLDISDVLARVFTTGSLFYGNATTSGFGYLVPKYDGTPPLFAAGIWIGGTVDGEVRVAGSTYDDFEFWPGPLGDDGRPVDPDDCSPYDRIWTVNAYDVAYYDATSEARADLAEWPVDLGAPVIDGDGIEGNYNLAGGDRPEVYGHQAAFWVMNDVGNIHRNTLTEPLGLEVRVTAFSSVEALLDRHTFYRYEVVNKSANTIEAGRFGFFVDPDLGDASDDSIGSDTTRSMAFVYNEDETDAVYGIPPAVGYDLLTGAGASSYFRSEGAGSPTADPTDGIGMYNFLQGLWGDGTPMTERGTGYQTDGPPITWAFPGDPVTGTFWSEENTDGNGNSNTGGDRRHLLSSEPFELAPGETRTFDLAILFAQGTDRLNSVTTLRAFSDAVQDRYDSGTLFAPSPLTFPPPGSLPTPEIVAPEDGAFFLDEVELAWTEVPGAEGYGLDFSTDQEFRTLVDLLPDAVLPASGEQRGEVVTAAVTGIANETTTYFWRVQAIAGPLQSFFSETRSFTIYRYVPEYFGFDGERIAEVAYPGVDDVCADAPTDPGCEEGVGNTVFENPNSTSDYFLTSGSSLGSLIQEELIAADDFELRFTEDCATPGNCLGAYIRDSGEIVSVPFELWNIRDEEDPGDDVRMVPMIRTTSGTDPLTDWEGAFPDLFENYVVAPGDTVDVGLTHRVFWLMPDRPNGYDLFEAAANSFGGPGAIYVPEEDGDEQIDLNADGGVCAVQDYYVDFCYRAVAPYRAPIGGAGSAGMQIADLAGDGSTPPAGTVVRFVSNDPLFVDTEDDTAAPSMLAIVSAYPNPFRFEATVEYTLDAAGDAELVVYDLLGRRVATLEEGVKTAGLHRAQIDGRGLASGVYVLVLDANGERRARKVMVVR